MHARTWQLEVVTTENELEDAGKLRAQLRRLREAGAIVVGKTNLDEFGMGSTTEGSAFQVGGPDPHIF